MHLLFSGFTRRFLPIFLSALVLNFLSISAKADIDLYIDSNVTLSGDGTLGTPFKEFSDIDWTVIQNDLDNDTPVTIHLKRGAQWRERLYIDASGHDAAAGTSGQDVWLTVTDYGDGASPRPLILGSQPLSLVSDWRKMTSTEYLGYFPSGGGPGIDNLWVTADNSFPSSINSSTGTPYPKVSGSYFGDVGLLALIDTNNQVSIGYWVSDINDLDGLNGKGLDPSSPDENNPYEYMHEKSRGRIIMYSPGNPASLFSTIEAGHPSQDDGILIISQKYIEIKNIASKFNSRNAIHIRGGRTVETNPDAVASHIVVDNVDVEWSGGRHWDPNSDAVLGNGIQNDYGVENIEIKNSTVSQVWDTAIAFEAFESNDVTNAVNVHDNTISFSGNGVEVSSKSQANPSHVDNVHIHDNTVSDMGLGWSGLVRNAQKGTGMSFFERPGDTLNNLVVENNVISNYYRQGIRVREGNFTIRNNKIISGNKAYSGADPVAGGADDYAVGILIHGGDSDNSNPDGEATGTISNNLVIDNPGYGLYMINNKPTNNEELKIVNNTFYKFGDGGFFIRNSDLVAHNNIVYSTVSLPLYLYGGQNTSTSDNNIYYRDPSPSEVPSYYVGSTDPRYDPSVMVISNTTQYASTDIALYKSAMESNSYFADPIFYSPGDNDFSPLLCYSVAIDHGQDQGATMDYFNNPIPPGGVDIGAIESVVIDNTDTCKMDVDSGWATGSVTSGAYKGTYLVSTAGDGTTTRSLKWNFIAPNAGTYAVSVRWTSGNNRSDNAPYTVSIAGIQQGGIIPENQQNNGNMWVELGTYQLTGGEQLSVGLSNDGADPTYVIGDAVKILYVSP